MSGPRRTYLFKCSVVPGARAPARIPGAASQLPELAVVLRRAPTVRHFEGACFICHAARHSQNYCWLRRCSYCNVWGHSESVCLLLVHHDRPVPMLPPPPVAVARRPPAPVLPPPPLQSPSVS